MQAYDGLGKTLDDAIKRADPEVMALVDFHLTNLGEAFCDVLKIFSNNRARQRRKLAKVLGKLQGLAAQACDVQVGLEAVWQHRSVVAPAYPWGLHSYINYHIGEVCIRYLLLGFELKLYAQHEFHMVWYHIEILLGWHSNNIGTALQRNAAAAVESQAEKEAAAVAAAATNSAAAAAATAAANDGGGAGGTGSVGGGGGGKKKKKKKKKAKGATPQALPISFDDVSMHYAGLRSLCKAMLMCCSAAQMEGRFVTKKLQFTPMEVLFAHRFKAFQQVDCLPQVSYQHFLTQTDVSGLPGQGIFADKLYLHATKSFEDAADCFQTLLTAPNPPSPRMRAELESLVRVAKTNIVSNRLAAMQSQQAQTAGAAKEDQTTRTVAEGGLEPSPAQEVQVSFDFSNHPEFPIVKFR